MGVWFALAGVLLAAEWVVRWASFQRTYHYHEVEDVYWENQNTLLLYLPDPTVFWRLRPGIRLKATVAGEGACKSTVSRTGAIWGTMVNKMSSSSAPSISPRAALSLVRTALRKV